MSEENDEEFNIKNIIEKVEEFNEKYKDRGNIELQDVNEFGKYFSLINKEIWEKEMDKTREVTLEDTLLNILLGSNSADKEPQIIEPSYLEEETIPAIEHTLGIKLNDTYQIQKFPDGKSLLRRTFSNMIDKYRDVYCEENDISLTSRFKNSLINLFKIPYQRKQISYMSDRVMGTSDIDVLFDDIGVLEHELPEAIGIVHRNIEEFSDNKEISPKLGEKYTITHETIHKGQKRNFPDVEDKRGDLIRKKFSGVEDQEQIEDKLNAYMSALEGHAEFFTNQIFEDQIEDLERNYNFRQKFWTKFYGLEPVIERYTKGSEFIDQLYREGGTELANLAIERPPESMEEIENPEQYIERISP
ncbi:MAG: zinc-dependent metalloprotease [Candidatus Aenigmatarchaeota archaeon]